MEKIKPLHCVALLKLFSDIRHYVGNEAYSIRPIETQLQ